MREVNRHRESGIVALCSLFERIRTLPNQIEYTSGSTGLQIWADQVMAIPELARAATLVADADGDELNAHVLVQTGVAAELVSSDGADSQVLAEELWHYLTRPTTAHFEAVALDLPRLPVDLQISDWRAWNPTKNDFAQFAPVPSAASRRSHDPWPIEVVSQHALLIRHVKDHEGRGFRLRFRGRRHQLDAAWPLAVLNLYSQHVVGGAALFDIWKHDRVERHGDGVYAEPEPCDPADPDGPWGLRAFHGNFRVRDADRLVRFCTVIDSRRLRLVETNNKLAARLGRAANHFVTANADSWPDGTADSDVRPDVVLRYVTCLESLLSSNQGAISRTVSQRASLLITGPGPAAVVNYETVKSAYKARSRHVHGDDVPTVDLRALREVTRLVLMRWLVLASGLVATADKKNMNEIPGEIETLLDESMLNPSIWKSAALPHFQALRDEVLGESARST